MDLDAVTIASPRLPPGPLAAYNTSQELLGWMAEQFQQFGSIYKASIYGVAVYAICAPEHVERVLLKNWQNYPKGQAIKRIALLLGNGLMVSKGEFWKKQRRMLQPAFQRKSVIGLIDVIKTANSSLLEKWERAARENRTVNVTRDISLMILDIVLISIFGDDYERVAPHFGIVSDESVRDLQFAQAFNALRKVVVQVAHQRRKENRAATDFLGALMDARDRESGDAMPDAQLAREIMTLVVAGHETTASALNWTWYLLSQYPEVEKKLSNELSKWRGTELPDFDDLPNFTYTRQVIDEALRLYPPGWLMTRKALTDDYLGEYFVPAGTEIFISPYFIQRHPGFWEAPDRFDPERFDERCPHDRHPLVMLPFSVGPRNCIGELLARVEMQIHLMMVGQRLRLRYDQAQPPELAAAVNLLSKNEFIMTPELKTPDQPSSHAKSPMTLLPSQSA